MNQIETTHPARRTLGAHKNITRKDYGPPKFIELDDTLINLQHVVKIEFLERDKATGLEQARLHTADSSVEILRKEDLRDFLTHLLLTDLVPVNGFALVTAHNDDDEGDWVETVPVVALRVDQPSRSMSIPLVLAITADGRDFNIGDSSWTALRYPDGSLTNGDETFANIDDFRAAFAQAQEARSK